MVGQALIRQGTRENYPIVTAERNALDLRDSAKVLKYLKKQQPDLVIAAAAKVGGIYANSSNKADFLVNNLGIQNSLIMGALNAGVKNFIFLGSSCIYPRDASQPIQEDSLLSGPLESTNEAYALAKIAGVKLCEYIREKYGLNYFSLMPTNLYGPGDNFDLNNSHVPAALVRKFHDGKTRGDSAVKVWGTGSPMREFMHVDDLADAIWFTSHNPPNHYLVNVGFGKEISIREFAYKVARVTGYKGEVEFDDSRPDGTSRKLLDSSRISSMGWSPKISLEEGLKSTYKWFTENIELGTVRGYDT
jgi:GDP-L-fucose synthase